MRKCLAILAAVWLAIPALAQDAMLIGAGSPSKVASGGGYTGPGDVQSGAFAWWGFRAYDSTAASTHQNVIQVCNNSGTFTGTNCLNVTANTNGTITFPAAGACNGSNCTLVKTIYDQSRANSCGGSPCNMTQGTLANIPTFVSSGLFSVHLTPSNGTFLAPSAITLTQPYSISAITTRNAQSGGNAAFFSNNASGNALIWSSTNPSALCVASAFCSSNTIAIGTPAAGEFLIGTSGSIDVDGTSASGNSSILTFSAELPVIGDGSNTDTLEVTELGIWNSDISSHFAGLITNQQAFCTASGTSC